MSNSSDSDRPKRGRPAKEVIVNRLPQLSTNSKYFKHMPYFMRVEKEYKEIHRDIPRSTSVQVPLNPYFNMNIFKEAPVKKYDIERTREPRTKKVQQQEKIIHQPTVEESSETEIDETESSYEIEEVEKILARSEIKYENEESKNLILIKSYSSSYIHNRWMEESEMSRGANLKYRQFNKKATKHSVEYQFEKIPENLRGFFTGVIVDLNIFYCEEIFNREFLLIDRILDIQEEQLDEHSYCDGMGGSSCLITGEEEPRNRLIYTETKKSCLVKWKAFDYEYSTYESIDCVSYLNGGVAIEQYYEKVNNYTHYNRERREPINKISLKRKFELRSYQVEGIKWSLNNYREGRSSIMADEMGLGKTVQSISTLFSVYRIENINQKSIVVVPLSTVEHWVKEFSEWTNLNTVIFHGNEVKRSSLLKYEIPSAHVIITTYEMSGFLNQIRYKIGIFDEAHRLKNNRSKIYRNFLNYNIEHKILSTGTPSQNNLNESFSLSHFIDPSLFNNEERFMAMYSSKSGSDIDKSQSILRPRMVRRMKDDVEEIPDKTEIVVEVESSRIQKVFYNSIINNHKEYSNVMMELRKCCSHPYLITGGREYIQSNFPAKEILLLSSGKFVFLAKLSEKYSENNILIFSQMTKCSDLIGEFLTSRNLTYERIDGSVKREKRDEAIENFNQKKSRIFLLCTRAGGVGINSTSANICIIFDSDWNPQNDLQATARCHRIGQKEHVTIYRLLVKDSYEEEIFYRAGRKLGSDRAVLQKNLEYKEERKEYLEQLLHKGAYTIQEEEDSFINEDIDSILMKRTVSVNDTKSENIFSSIKIDEVAITNKSDINIKKQCRRSSTSQIDRQTIGNSMVQSTNIYLKNLFVIIYKGIYTVDKEIVKAIANMALLFIEEKQRPEFEAYLETNSTNVLGDLGEEEYNLFKEHSRSVLSIIQILNYSHVNIKQYSIISNNDIELVEYVSLNGYNNYPSAVNEKNKSIFGGGSPAILNKRVRAVAIHFATIDEEMEHMMDFGGAKMKKYADFLSKNKGRVGEEKLKMRLQQIENIKDEEIKKRVGEIGLSKLAEEMGISVEEIFNK